jgi:hypothetical protein
MSEFRESQPSKPSGDTFCHELAERPEPTDRPEHLDSPEHEHIERAGESDHELDQFDLHLPAGEVEITIQNQKPFAELRQQAIDAGTYGPGAVRLEDARPPFKEHPGCAEPERYVHMRSADRRLDELYVDLGVARKPIEAINPKDNTDGLRDDNCAETARAVASMLNGQPRSACPMRRDASGALGEDIHQMEVWTGRPTLERNMNGDSERLARDISWERVDPKVAAGFAAMEDELRRAGDGAHAVVYTGWNPIGARSPDQLMRVRSGHWFNAVNVDGRIKYIDAQNRDNDFLVTEVGSTGIMNTQRKAMRMSWIRADGVGR